ncbi:MAG: PAS domain S-box protein [Verrucomicrobia bacterium]|nr:PAS domain S-box protein [Verrucomicrobiota bacterium]
MSASTKILLGGLSSPAAARLIQALSGAGYGVLRAESGVEILREVQHESPSLLLLDLDSPVIDPMNVCRRIKADYAARPVMVLYLADAARAREAHADTFTEPDGYIAPSISHEEFLERIASFLRIHSAERSLHQHAERLSAITAIQQEIAAAAPDQESIMKLAVSRAQQLTRADGAAVELVEGDEIVYRSASGSVASHVGKRLRVGMSFSGLAIRTDEILRCDDAHTDPRVDQTECREGSIRSLVVVPLRHQYNSIGALKVLSSRSRAFDDADIQTLQLVAHFMSAAINQAVAFGAKQALLAEHTRTIVALRESEERFRSAFDYAAIGMALVATSGKWMKVNRTLCEIVGYAEGDFRSLYFHSLTHPDDVADHQARLRGLLAGESGAFQMEARFLHRSGSVVWVFLSVSLLRDGKGKPLYFIAQIQNITERKRADEQVKSSLREKEVLLKEIHHRVKNNLQVISSLLRLQSGYVKDEAAKELFRESQNRVRSMALIHQKLYQSQDLARIDFNEYLLSLLAMLFRSYGAHAGTINLETHVDPVFLDIDTAIPVGLLVNELASNSLKYAFPENRCGTIRIDFRAVGHDEFVLALRDDGIGLPGDFDLDKVLTLGLRLVKILTSQLGGTLTFHRNGGTGFTVTFKEQKEKEKKLSHV